MPFEWNKDLSTGIPWQDKQHKELFKRLNKLLEAMNVGLGKTEVVRFFTFLDEYVVIHFHTEEEAMDKANFPETVEQLKDHTRFIEDLAKLKAEFEKGPSSALVMQVKRQVVDWLINHIGVEDKKFGEFVIKAEAQRKGRI